MASEFDFITWLRAQTPDADPRVLIGPGDDTAILAPAARPQLVTVDMLMDGTDFRLEEVGPRAAGRKAMAVNLSDIAAMAGNPVAAVVSVSLPRNQGRELGENLYLGLRDVADQFQVPIVGGDTNSWEHPLVISVTVLGESADPVLRSGARCGDWLFVTGPLGGSITGKHLSFTPRVREALQLREAANLHAMIDISDGLAADLNHIVEESRCGAVLFAGEIPIASEALELSRVSGKTPLEHALGDGEDFELLFAVSPSDGKRLLREQPVPGITLSRIGECADAGLWLESNGVRSKLDPVGWVHPL